MHDAQIRDYALMKWMNWPCSLKNIVENLNWQRESRTIEIPKQLKYLKSFLSLLP